MSDQTRKIIIVDDNSDDIFLSRLVVSKSKHPLETLEFLDPHLALEYFSSNETDSSDILFLDINMPRLNGFEFIERYRKLKDNEIGRLKIVLLTTSLHSSDKERAEANDFVYLFLRKPLTIAIYTQLIESIDEPA